MIWRSMTRDEAKAVHAAWKDAASKWHRWFAWFPVCEGWDTRYYYLEDRATTKPTGRVIWLQMVERRMIYEGGEFGGSYLYEYRLPSHDAASSEERKS